MHGYKAFYASKSIDVYADSSLAAKNKAVAAFKVSPKKAHMVSVHLCEKDVSAETGNGTQIVHVASD